LEYRGEKPIKNRTQYIQERAVQITFFICAAVSIVAVFSIFFSLFAEGYPFISNWFLNGFGMHWLPHAGQYGPTPLIINTLYAGVGCTIVAAIIGVPTAIYLAEFADNRLRNIIKPCLEILTGFPSVIIGVVAVFTLTPALFAGNLRGTGMFAVWIVVGIMSLPTVATISEDAIKAVPRELKEASLGLGATRWQTMTRVIIPAAMSGILAAIILGMGSAVGETMAAFFVAGVVGIPGVTLNPFQSTALIPVAILRESASDAGVGGNMAPYFALGFILFFIVGALNLAIRRLSKESLAASTKKG